MGKLVVAFLVFAALVLPAMAQNQFTTLPIPTIPVSQLPAAGTLTGTELFYVVQSGVSKSVTFSSLRQSLFISPVFTGQPVIPGLPGLTTNVEGGGAPGLDMPGCATVATCAWEIFSSPTAYPAANQPTLFITKVAPATGGIAADDYNAILVQQVTGLNDAGAQWAISSVVLARTLASANGQAIAVAGTIFKQLNGQAPGTPIEVYSAALYGQCVDETLDVDPISSCLGGEIDSYALAGSGTDVHNQRVALQLNGGTNGATDTGVHVGTLLLMTTNNGVVIDRAMLVKDSSNTQTFLVAGNGATQINSNLGSWGNANAGKQLIVMPEVNAQVNPAIGISDTNSTNFIALVNSTGTLLVQGMPALTDSVTAPVIFAEFAAGSFITPNLPTSAGGGGLYDCIDSSGAHYRKSSCP